MTRRQTNKIYDLAMRILQWREKELKEWVRNRFSKPLGSLNVAEASDAIGALIGEVEKQRQKSREAYEFWQGKEVDIPLSGEEYFLARKAVRA